MEEKRSYVEKKRRDIIGRGRHINLSEESMKDVEDALIKAGYDGLDGLKEKINEWHEERKKVGFNP